MKADEFESGTGMQQTILTYGTFDLFHMGHLRLLERLRAMGDRLIVGVSTDEFNAQKGKTTIIPFSERIAIVRALRCVSIAIPEDCWEQKRRDIDRYHVATLGMGNDWAGKFDDLTDQCDVVYLPRTEGISTSALKEALRVVDRSHIGDLKKALDLISSIVQRFE